MIQNHNAINLRVVYLITASNLQNPKQCATHLNRHHETVLKFVFNSNSLWDNSVFLLPSIFCAA